VGRGHGVRAAPDRGGCGLDRERRRLRADAVGVRNAGALLPSRLARAERALPHLVTLLGDVLAHSAPASRARRIGALRSAPRRVAIPRHAMTAWPTIVPA